MVRKLSLPVLLLIVVFTAAGCKFFAASLFPSYLTQISAFIDLGEEMDGFIGSAGEDFDCSLYVLKNSSDQEYIFVKIHVFSPDKKKVIILDNSLKVQKELEDPDLAELHMVDVNGDFIIGYVRFSQVDLTSTNLAINPYRQGFSDGANNYVMWIDSGSPDQLQYRQYDSAWIAGFTYSPWIGTGVFSLENSGYSTARNEVALFLNRQGDDFSQVVLIPAAAFGALTQPIISSYPVFPVESADNRNYNYINDGIVVNTNDNVAKLYGFDGKVRAEFPFDDDHRQIQAYDGEGEYYYHLDIPDRRLYKCTTWW